MMSGLLLMSCTQQNDLTFNEMVNQTEITAKGIDTTALFYESSATKELTGVKSVFAGINNTTIEVLCDSNGKTESKVIDSPFMEDEVIHLPVKLTLEDAEQILLDSGYGTGVEGVADWSEVVLRRPLEPGFNVAQYIFTTKETNWKTFGTFPKQFWNISRNVPANFRANCGQFPEIFS